MGKVQTVSHGGAQMDHTHTYVKTNTHTCSRFRFVSHNWGLQKGKGKLFLLRYFSVGTLNLSDLYKVSTASSAGWCGIEDIFSRQRWSWWVLSANLEGCQCMTDIMGNVQCAKRLCTKRNDIPSLSPPLFPSLHLSFVLFPFFSLSVLMIWELTHDRSYRRP